LTRPRASNTRKRTRIQREKEELIYEEVSGILTTTWSQDKYADGTYSRSESEYTEFEITDKLNQ